MTRKKKSTYDNLQGQIRNLKTPPLEVWENQYSDKEYLIHIETREFNCICPKTGLPDFARICIEYAPAKYCIELKSFKEYLFFYREVGIFHEHVVNKILDDFIKVCNPRYTKIVGEFNIRGGIKTTVSREYKRKGYKSK
ncbi:MAG: NADPH-dependent 7-cyano-7-deazaguanine reductase QueF [Candidatus Omnitrophica bacterium]|nr:NADPH-dependent 7-cyano-7-deazaguanine reductase QueF [Candidatus Omnitrophota bacterium]